MAIEAMLSRGDSIPVLDVQRTRHELLLQLRHAMTEVGFFYVKNTGFSDTLSNDMKALLPALFKISSDEKATIDLETSPHFLGYSGVGSETTAGKADIREQFEFATFPASYRPSADQPLYQNLFGPNQYPHSIPEARSIIDTYMTTLSTYAEQLLELMAAALGLPENAFNPYLSGSNRLKVVRYPETRDGVLAQGVGPHKDSSGLLTLLLQASPPSIKGLQVLARSGDWIDVPSIRDTFVVNMGQLFEVLTHGTCKATIHRVVGVVEERFSVPLFIGARLDLTKEEAVRAFAEYFNQESIESVEGGHIDSPFLRGKYNTWGESQFRTKVRSHRKAGKRFYPEVYEQYINDS